MSAAAVYMGFGASALDSKGRFSLPAAFRATLADHCKNPNSVLLGVDADHPYLSVFGDLQVPYFQGKFENRAQIAMTRGEEIDEDQLLADFWSGIVNVTVDSGGRFSIPADHRDYAQIDKGLFIVGAGPRIQLWKPENYLASNPKNPVATNACRRLIAELESKGKGKA